MNEYTIEEIKYHNHKNDCWLVANNNVYNVTEFIKLHPAGSGSILKYAGTDCTEHFNFHSKKAHKIWNEYKIGKIKKERCSIFERLFYR